ncbi:hypothetical protein GCK72_008546 [Caenorhabditis remanei]|uniref:F-box domain-containing protein n=1 Tax=Caenorhabditis remanei TaxID=31234 RepID=A0A6A5H016_CAERE|nr:hypothetical protein GCK72_008546 [Caenorhabditis remanei]KAF1760299.1 hypothetical protein GCK72_008546 [Caenorhabditis remanei]
MEPTFPLLRLPENAIFNVLKNTNLDQLFIISLVSSKTKSLVTSFGIKARDVHIGISRRIRINVYTTKSHFTLSIYNDPNDKNELFYADITPPITDYFKYQSRRIQTTTPFNFSDWMKHIQLVFCYSQPLDLGFYQYCERFEVQSLKDAIGNVDVLSVAGQVTDVYKKEVLKCFNAPNELFLERNPFDEVCEIQKLFIQNYKMIAFPGVYSLDDMLLVNSEKVRFTKPISQKQFNQFLKHWIRGSNPRLQYMFLSIDNTDSVSSEEPLKGIDCFDVAEEDQQEICRKYRIKSYYMVAIRRKDGTPAVIAAEDFLNVLCVRFIVFY